MKTISICSMFRDSDIWFSKRIGQVDRFFYSLNEQAYEANCELEFFLLEGDSKDATYKILESYSKLYKVNLSKRDLGGSGPDSSGRDERRKILSEAGNACLKPALEANNDWILWMESDLIPQKGMLKKLLAGKDLPNTGMIAPLTIIRFNNQNQFYDGWAFEGLNGEKWGLNDTEKFCKQENPVKLKSLGSCALLNGKVLKENKIDFGDGNFPKMCQSLLNLGYNIYCDHSALIFHPSSECSRGRWI